MLTAQSHPNVLIASAQPLLADRDLLDSLPHVQWWDGRLPLSSFWNDLPANVRSSMALFLWTLPHRAPREQLAAEDAMRHQLNELGHPYRTLEAQSFAAVLELALYPLQPTPQQTDLAQQQWQRWQQRGCEKCSDPRCEHRLFQDLLQQRAKVAPNR